MRVGQGAISMMNSRRRIAIRCVILGSLLFIASLTSVSIDPYDQTSIIAYVLFICGVLVLLFPLARETYLGYCEMREWYRLSDFHCPKCDYSLRGTDGKRCPECGWERGDESA